MVYSMARKNALYQVHRGVYRLYSAEDLENPEYFRTFVACEDAVLCLVSALSFHDLTDEVPCRVDIALQRRTAPPTLLWPPIKVYFFSGEAFESGILNIKIDGVVGRVYSREKTLADCFKYRNKIGLDIVLKALGRYLQSDETNISELLNQARICRVYNVLKPYLEAFIQDV
jgi:predicted transcriptional regulator of viral defense system